MVRVYLETPNGESRLSGFAAWSQSGVFRATMNGSNLLKKLLLVTIDGLDLLGFATLIVAIDVIYM